MHFSAPFTKATIDTSSATINPFVVTVLGGSSSQTVTFQNDVAGSTNLCGATYTSLKTSPQPVWLTVDSATNTLTVEVTDATESTGTFTVTIQQYLVDFEIAGLTSQLSF
jgi:hypothetical protein